MESPCRSIRAFLEYRRKTKMSAVLFFATFSEMKTESNKAADTYGEPRRAHRRSPPLLGLTLMKKGYCLSCYAPGAYVFTVPLRASTIWLKKVLGHKYLVNATPLRKAQVDMLRRRVIQPAEVGWYAELEYFLESYEIGHKPNNKQCAPPKRSEAS